MTDGESKAAKVREVIDTLGHMARVHFAPERVGVEVPPGASAGPSCALHLSRKFAPDPKIEIDPARGFAASLSFENAIHRVFVPWSAVYAIEDTVTGVGTAWHGFEPGQPDTATTPKPEIKRAHLRLVN